jgi:hypothetical protein
MAKPRKKTSKLDASNPDVGASGVGDGDPIEGDQQLARFVHQFNLSADTTMDARKQAQIHRDYYDGKQWSDHEVEVLRTRGQPAITDNRIKDKIEYLLGLERQTRTDPKAFPRTPQDDPGADAATDALRYIADCSNFAQIKSSVFENMTVEGFGGAEIIVDNNQTYGKSGNKKVTIRYIRWDRLYYDGHSLLRDFSDSRYQGIVKWMDLDEAKVTYPKIGDAFDLFTSQSFTQPSDTYDDRPRWFDRGRKRVQILEHYYKQGDKWYRVVFSRVGIIEDPTESVYVDAETGKPECPLILQSLYVDRNGNRYGVVKRYKDLQDEINKRRSKSLHLLSVNQATAEKGAVDDIEAARKELARPDGFLEYTPGMKLDIRENADLAEGQFKLLQEAIVALSGTGPNEALLGTTGDLSGRAKQVDQQGGAIQLGILTDSLRYWQKRVMVAAWNRIKQFWTDEMWVRITDDENSRFLALNSSYPQNHPHVQKGMAQPGAPMNHVADMDVDIIIDESPDVVTVQQEQFQQLVDLAKGGVPIPPQAIIQASNLRNKQQVLDAMSGKLPDGTEIPPQVQQMLQQKEQQIQQITQAQQQKAQEQQQAETALNQQKAEAQLQLVQVQAAMDKLKATQAGFEAQFGARQQELEAQMEMLNAKEIELKALQLLAAQKLEATQNAANAIVDGASKEATITALTTKLETQQSEHKKQVADLGLQHAQQLHQERQKTQAASEPDAKPKPRKIAVERDQQGRIVGATVN